MSKNTNTAFVLGIRSTNSEGENKLFAIKNPRRNTIVDVASGEKFKVFGTYRTAFRWIRKLADLNIPGLDGLEVVRITRPKASFATTPDSFLG